MGLLEALIKVAPAVIEFIGDLTDDGKRNNSNQKK